jgi:hypothetical protein
MKAKPITPTLHGLIDYAFAVALFTVPGMIGSDKETRRIYKLIAMEVFLYGALSKQPLALKGLIPFRIHKKIDLANLTGLSLLGAFKGIRKHPATLAFHISTTLSGLASVLLTKWKNKLAA